MVPQEPVPQAGHQERDGNLGVALDQLDHRALLIEPAVLVLAEPVEPLAVPRIKQHFGVMEPGTPPGRGVPSLRRTGEVRRHFGQQFGTVAGAHKPQPAAGGDPGGQPAIDDLGQVRRNVGPRVSVGRRREQRPRQVVADFPLDRAADPEAIRPPRLDPHGLIASPPLDRRGVLAKDTHPERPPRPSLCRPLRQEIRPGRLRIDSRNRFEPCA
jgi:hypothetical protein